MPIDVSNAPVRRPGDRGKFGVAWQPGMRRQNPPGGMGPWNQTNPGPVVIVFSGPWFSIGPQLIADAVAEMQYRLTAAALERVQFVLDRSIQHPTPYYETQIMMQPLANGDMVVHDRGIIYGPWLEGTSHRNQTTRFKGYHAFRRATDNVRQRAGAICQQVANEVMARLR